jgi:hypothetical protein
MISTAQKKARENFKKAIEYRKKTGCTLKQAFAHISGKKTVIKKVGTVKKTNKKKIGATPKKDYIFNAFKYKTNPKTGGYEVQEKKQFKIVSTNLENATNNAHKKYPYPFVIELNNSSIKTSKKVGVIKKKVLHSPLKKKAVKKPISTHKDTKSHNVNIKVVSGFGELNRDYLKELTNIISELDRNKNHIESLRKFKKHDLKYFKEGHKQELLTRYLLRDKYLKTQITQLKKHIK